MMIRDDVDDDGNYDDVDGGGYDDVDGGEYDGA